MMPNYTDSLMAFATLITRTAREVSTNATSHNRMNRMGEGLEDFIKDLYCNSFDLSVEQRMQKHSQTFSWLGNQNNVPDAMIYDGDAIEVKKVENIKNSVQLNSSFPKNKLYADDTRISAGCRTCENWSERDLLYAIGQVNNSELRKLWLVYGDCYAADKEVYAAVGDTMTAGLQSLPGVTLEETNELGRVNRVDPLGITDLRVRGMWIIRSPEKVFEYFSDDLGSFANMLMLTRKYESFPDSSKSQIESLTSERFRILDKAVQDPNNPARLLPAKLFALNQ